MTKLTNKQTTQAEYKRRINKALEFIVENLDQNLSLENIAKASHFSPYHFHRIFQSIIGETVNEYVHRKKMEKAASTLVCSSNLTITNVAELLGFSSSANFSKAFKLYFGVSPSQLRNPQQQQISKIGKLYSKYGKAFNIQDLYSQTVTQTVTFNPDKLENILMNIKLENMEEKQIAYLTSPKGYELDSIFETCDKMLAWAKATDIEDYEHKLYAICHDNPMVTPKDKCRYDAAITITSDVEVRAPYTKSIIPAGKYAVAYYKGDGDKVSNFYIELYSNWLSNSGFEPDHFPPVEHYLNDTRQDGFVEMEVHIKVKELAAS